MNRRVSSVCIHFCTLQTKTVHKSTQQSGIQKSHLYVNIHQTKSIHITDYMLMHNFRICMYVYEDRYTVIVQERVILFNYLFYLCASTKKGVLKTSHVKKISPCFSKKPKFFSEYSFSYILVFYHQELALSPLYLIQKIYIVYY